MVSAGDAVAVMERLMLPVTTDVFAMGVHDELEPVILVAEKHAE